jgi:hypothetical protein
VPPVSFQQFIIAPSIPDDSTADRKLNQALFGLEEALEQFENCSIEELLRPLPDFTPISIKQHKGRPQNIDIN